MTTHREELERTLATAPFAETYGFVLVSIDDDSCTLRIPFRPVLERPGGIIAGPVYMAAADVTMWLRLRRGMVTNHRLRRAWLLILSAGDAVRMCCAAPGSSGQDDG